MHVVDIHGHLYRNNRNEPRLYVKGFDYGLERMVEHFFRGPGNNVPIVARFFPVQGDFITDEQRGYIFGHLGPKAYDYLRNQGIAVRSVHEAIDFMKINEDIKFVEPVIDYGTGEYKEIPMSLATSSPNREDWAPREEVSRFIDRLYLFLLNQGMKPQKPAIYHRQKRWKSV